MTSSEKDKRKGRPPSHPPWVYLLMGAAVGTIGASFAIHVLNEVYRATYAAPVPLMVFALGVLLLIIAAAAAFYGMSTASQTGPSLRQNPDNPLMIQEQIGEEWQDVLTVILPTQTIEMPEKAKLSPPTHRSSLLWAVLAAVATSLYSLFLAQPPRERK